MHAEIWLLFYAGTTQTALSYNSPRIWTASETLYPEWGQQRTGGSWDIALRKQALRPAIRTIFRLHEQQRRPPNTQELFRLRLSSTQGLLWVHLRWIPCRTRTGRFVTRTPSCWGDSTCVYHVNKQQHIIEELWLYKFVSRRTKFEAWAKALKGTWGLWGMMQGYIHQRNSYVPPPLFTFLSAWCGFLPSWQEEERLVQSSDHWWPTGLGLKQKLF